MTNLIANIKIPDSKLAVEAAELLREHSDDLLWNHSNRVFLFAAMRGNLNQIKYDAELLYISSLFTISALLPDSEARTNVLRSMVLMLPVIFLKAAASRTIPFGSYGMLLPCIQASESSNIRKRK